jgi:hypothetical protein
MLENPCGKPFFALLFDILFINIVGKITNNCGTWQLHFSTFIYIVENSCGKMWIHVNK